jgi:DNA helicase-2/ATP-dependent DNA helicase PcrA
MIMSHKAQPQLDASQRAFCESAADYIRLLAPAGCGKTLALAHRCLHLLQRDPDKKPRFLVVTFTRAARDELRSRLMSESIFEPLRGCVDVVTLNQWGYRRLRSFDRNHRLLTNHNDFHFGMMNDLKPVWEKHDKVRCVVETNKGKNPRKLFELLDGFKAIGFDHEQDSNFEKFLSRVNSFQQQGLTRTWVRLLEPLQELGVLERELDRPEVAYCSKLLKLVYDDFFRFWRESVSHLASMSKFTLEDQKYRTYLFESAQLRKKKFLSGAACIHHLLVDEFQDINPLDLALLKCIAERNRSTVTIVGDDDQAIYEWRGATPRYILEPQNYFGRPFETFILSTNYRSPKNIVSRSHNLIAHNSLRVDKKVVAKQNTNAAIEVVKCAKVNEGIERVIAEYHLLSESALSSPRLAVVARKRAQIMPIQIHLASKGIEFCAADDLQIFLSVAFEKLISLLEIKQACLEKQRPNRVREDFIRLCDLVKRFPVSKIERESLIPFLASIAPASLLESADALEEYKGPLKGSNQDGKMSLNFAQKIRSFLEATRVSDSLRILAEEFDGLQKDFGKAEEDVFFTDPPFSQLAQYAESFGLNYESFIEAMERAKATLAKTPSQEDAECDLSSSEDLKRPIHLMTAQRAKGREFETVIVLDVNEGVWPCQQAWEDEAAMEEERRLFYVAITRPKSRLILTVQSDDSGLLPHPSRFLEEAKFESRKKIGVK